MPRLVLFSDTHEMHEQIEIPDGDILIFAGDMTFTGKLSKIFDFGVWLRKQMHKHKLIISGNHDWAFERAKKQAIANLIGDGLDLGLHYLENDAIELEGLKFYGSPITPVFNDWAFNVPRGKEIKKYWDKIPEGTDVLITHGPPSYILDQASTSLNTEHCGCEELRMRVKEIKPKVHVFGHIHGGYGRMAPSDGTNFYNASIVNEAYKVVNQPWVVDL